MVPKTVLKRKKGEVIVLQMRYILFNNLVSMV
jgi:hypothetical protein